MHAGSSASLWDRREVKPLTTGWMTMTLMMCFFLTACFLFLQNWGFSGVPEGLVYCTVKTQAGLFLFAFKKKINSRYFSSACWKITNLARLLSFIDYNIAQPPLDKPAKERLYLHWPLWRRKCHEKNRKTVLTLGSLNSRFSRKPPFFSLSFFRLAHTVFPSHWFRHASKLFLFPTHTIHRWPKGCGVYIKYCQGADYFLRQTRKN